MMNNTAITNEDISRAINTSVVAKFTTGRVVSGTIISRDNEFFIKLGTKYIPVNAEKISSLRSVEWFPRRLDADTTPYHQSPINLGAPHDRL